MKVIKARISEEKFLFPTIEDNTAFLELVHEGIEPKYRAWEVMGKLGWVLDDREDGYLVFRLPETKAEELELALKHHDWTYQYSDDYRGYVNGDREEKRIAKLIEEVGNPVAKELYDKYDYWKNRPM